MTSRKLEAPESLKELLDQPDGEVALPSAQANQLRRFARAFERLSAVVLAGEPIDQRLQRLLEIFVEVASVDVGVLRLREGDRLCSRVAVGLEEVETGTSVPIDEGILGREAKARAILSWSPMDATSVSELIGRSDLRGIYSVELVHADQLVGVVYLGTPEDHALPAEQKELLVTLAARSAAAIQQQTERDALVVGIRARDEVLGIVAHDLRNPMNVISLAANSLLHRLPDSAARRPIERIVRGAQRADRLIQDLLEINAIEGGQFVIDQRTVETTMTILAAIESQQALAANASVILATDLSPNLPSIEADEERILEVLENLIGNAVKFTSAGGTVTVGASARDREILFWVKDSGSGIPTEQLPHLFDRFWQARKKDRRGSGLGLTICKAIVEAHGGRIWPKTKPGEGTTMFFTIPAVARKVREKTIEVANILLVDDRPENLLSLKAILERPDYRILTASSGDEALRLVLRERFSVALIDIAMPRMNGLDVAVSMKALERSRDIPIIFVTAFGDDPEEIHRAYSAGGVDYLVKPLDSEIVRKKVAVFVDLNRRRNDSAYPEADPADRS